MSQGFSSAARGADGEETVVKTGVPLCPAALPCLHVADGIVQVWGLAGSHSWEEGTGPARASMQVLLGPS